jgi:hypothetical protein
MTEHKFTDDEIIKAIEICQKAKCWGDCEDMSCPAASRQGCCFYLRTDEDYEGVIQDEMLKDALDLINRQKAEIADERARKELCAEVIKRLDKESETTRAEAIKEFAERLKAFYTEDKRYDRPNAHTMLILLFATIDNLVKEMTEEKTKI